FDRWLAAPGRPLPRSWRRGPGGGEWISPRPLDRGSPRDPGGCILQDRASRDCRELAQPSEPVGCRGERLRWASPRGTAVAQGAQRPLQDIVRHASGGDRQELAPHLIVVQQGPGAFFIGTHPHPDRLGEVVLTTDQRPPAPLAHGPSSGWVGADV